MKKEISVGDVVEMRKNHPCGGNRFDVLRVGMDFRIRCQTCGRSLMLPRKKCEKQIKNVLPHNN